MHVNVYYYMYYTYQVYRVDNDLVYLLTQANNRIMQRSWLLRELYPVHVIHFQTKNVTGFNVFFTHLFELCDEIHLKESECRRYPLRSLTGYTGVLNLTLFAGAGGCSCGILRPAAAVTEWRPNDESQGTGLENREPLLRNRHASVTRVNKSFTVLRLIL